MSYRLFLILFFGIRQFVFCQNYNVSAIPKQLLLNADAVVRLDSGFIEIPTISEKKSYYKYAITILNKNASNEENIKLYENDFTKIKNLKIKLFDKEGQLIKNAKASEIKKSSLFSSTYDVTDDKIIEFKSDVSQYPYTIEYEYNKIDNNLFGESDWYFSSNSNISVQKSIVEFRIPSDLKIQYKIFDTTIVPQKQINKNTITYQWKIENISIQKPESYIPDTCIKKMYLNLKTDHFDFGGIKAQTNSWNELGKWSYELNVGRDSLSSETVSKILALTANAKTQKEKIDIIYRYVQKKVRYESVQLGIGGWKTFPAKYVDQYGIGDCKALSNYTMALLKSVGIKSYCAGVYSGEYSQNVIVPSNITMNFNHEILCVPMQKDTIWLECTSQALPTGYLSSFTSNRYALLSTQEGGKLVKIPSYSHHQNKIEREITISVDEKPTQSMLVKAKYSGTEMEDRIDLLRSTFNDQKKSILNEAKINSNQITAYDLQFSNEDKTSITETIKFGESNLIPKNTDSYICQPIIWGGNYKILPPNPERKCPVEISWNYIEQDTIIYEFNSPVIAEKIAPVHFSFVSGQYSLEQKVETNRLIWIRKLEFFNGIYPKEIYPELVRFMKNIRKSDKKICLVNVIK